METYTLFKYISIRSDDILKYNKVVQAYYLSKFALIFWQECFLRSGAEVSAGPLKLRLYLVQTLFQI